MTTATPQYTRKDFASDQIVRWCPGCGDYAILNSIQTVLAETGTPREKTVVVSGIGCAARLPYYVNAYGFHTIHGRAPALATGLKLSNPELDVWVISGDGDALSIGGNHLLHALRRNIGIKIVLFNNRIYGLTKGQTSPTSELGKLTKSTPMGSLDRPVHPLSVALAAEATFVARSVDIFPPHLKETLLKAAHHPGSAFIEVYQNCVIFNDSAFKDVTDRATRDEHVCYLEHKKPLRFGKDGEKGIRMNGLRPEVVAVGEGGVAESDLLVHDEGDAALAFLLARLGPPDFPTLLGAFHNKEIAPYETSVRGQMQAAKQKQGDGDLMSLIHSGDLWEVP